MVCWPQKGLDVCETGRSLSPPQAVWMESGVPLIGVLSPFCLPVSLLPASVFPAASQCWPGPPPPAKGPSPPDGRHLPDAPPLAPAAPSPLRLPAQNLGSGPPARQEVPSSIGCSPSLGPVREGGREWVGQGLGMPGPGVPPPTGSQECTAWGCWEGRGQLPAPHICSADLPLGKCSCERGQAPQAGGLAGGQWGSQAQLVTFCRGWGGCLGESTA